MAWGSEIGVEREFGGRLERFVLDTLRIGGGGGRLAGGRGGGATVGRPARKKEIA